MNSHTISIELRHKEDLEKVEAFNEVILGLQSMDEIVSFMAESFSKVENEIFEPKHPTLLYITQR